MFKNALWQLAVGKHERMGHEFLRLAVFHIKCNTSPVPHHSNYLVPSYCIFDSNCWCGGLVYFSLLLHRKCFTGKFRFIQTLPSALSSSKLGKGLILLTILITFSERSLSLTHQMNRAPLLLSCYR